MTNLNQDLTLEFKPDAEEAAKRWDAYWQNELLERPLLMISAPREGFQPMSGVGYRDKLYGNPKDIVDRLVHNMAGTIYGAELMPAFWGSVSSDEGASFCGADILFSGEPNGTSWSNHPVENWADWLPLAIDEQCLAFRRVLEIYGLAAAADFDGLARRNPGQHG